MIGIVDYGVGNLFSLETSLKHIGVETEITSSPEMLAKADKIILPGVGAFGDAIGKLRQSGLDKVVVREAANGKPLLGICLGMQLLFEEGWEHGTHGGLGLIPGVVKPMEKYAPDGRELDIPHMGWNRLFVEEDPIFRDFPDGSYVYFVHSYMACDCQDWIIGRAEYGYSVAAVVAKGNIYGTQFHPEKSGEMGLNILRGFNGVG